MPVVKNKTTDRNREFWSHIEQVTEQVNRWPDWMRNEPPKGTHETQVGSDHTVEPEEDPHAGERVA